MLKFWFIIDPSGKFPDVDKGFMFDVVGYKTRAAAIAGMLSYYTSDVTWSQLYRRGWRTIRYSLTDANPMA